jgi:hypothetical protein
MLLHFYFFATSSSDVAYFLILIVQWIE